MTEAHAPAWLRDMTRAQIIRAAFKHAALAYLRDALKDYEHGLVDACKRAELADRDIAIKAKILDVIAEAQPWLSGECTRRKERLYSST